MVEHSYIIRGGEQAIHRLAVLAQTFASETRAFLARMSVREGMHCLDIGCGNGAVTRLMAERVGPTGRVVGIDMDAAVLAHAQEQRHDDSAMIEFQERDVTQFDVNATYDVAYARFLLSHLREPLAVLQRMVSAVRPGGIVAVEDLDCRSYLVHPPSPAYIRYVNLYQEVAKVRGAHPHIGPELVNMFHTVGLSNIQLFVYLPVFHRGVEKTLSRLTVAAIAPAVCSAGFATTEEMQQLSVALQLMEADETSLLSSFLTFQVWGRKC